MRGELGRLHQQLQTTIIYVTHDQIEAMTLADRIVIMNQGAIMQIGSPMSVYEQPNNLFVAGFIGSPAMNFLKVNLIDQAGALAVTGENLTLKIPDHLQKRFSAAQDQNLTFGIRPEHIYDQALKGSFPGGETLKATIEVVEPIGSEVILLAKCGSTEITARVSPETQVKPQMPVQLIFDMNQMHLFDEETQQAY